MGLPYLKMYMSVESGLQYSQQEEWKAKYSRVMYSFYIYCSQVSQAFIGTTMYTTPKVQ
jgi:hypothetical protein